MVVPTSLTEAACALCAMIATSQEWVMYIILAGQEMYSLGQYVRTFGMSSELSGTCL